MAGKLQSKVTAIQKIETTRKLLKEKIEKFKNEKVSIQPLVGQLTEQTKMLQSKVITSIRMQIVFMSFFPLLMNAMFFSPKIFNHSDFTVFCRLKRIFRNDIKTVRLI